ncbi:MAG: SGNH/GDSL hydrolase family protein [Planctomycetes bacterium]|nr:SGNH/GDSL hydrolase family protein [Planctomycetota bacterium]
MSAKNGIGRKLAISALSGLCALVAVEVGLRVFRPVGFMKPEAPRDRDGGAWHGTIHRPSATKGLAYELAPSVDQDSLGVRVKTNALGLRDHELLDASTPNLFRVLAVGDSVTFGYRVDEPDCFASVLERELANSALAETRVFDVLNLGVSGYSTRDELAAFEGKWLALEPRLVLLNYCLNDPEIEPMQQLQRVFVAPRWWQYSHLLRFLVQKWQVKNVQALGGGNYFRYLHAPSEPAWRSVADGFARFGELGRDHRFHVVLAIFPLFSPKPWKDYPFRGVHAQVANEGAKNGFAVLDLLPRFEREDPASLLIDPKDSHPNAFGHRIAAEEMLHFLEAHPELLASSK